MKRWFCFLVVGMACRDAAPPAAPAPAHREEEKGHHGEHEELPRRVSLPPSVVASAKIEAAAVETSSLPPTLELAGEIAADPDRIADVVARVPGRIIEVRFKEGQRVKRGAVLAVVEAPELARVHATLATGEAKMRAAARNVERLSALAAKALTADQEVVTARAELDAHTAETRAARQTLAAFGAAGADSAGRVALRAPIDGDVLARDAILGQAVDANHVVATVGRLERAHFVARLFEKDIAQVRLQAAADVRLNAYPHVVFSGRVEAIGRRLDPSARTVTARIVVDDEASLLKLGLFGTARVVSAAAAPASARLVVPLSSVTQVAGSDVVFVREADGAFEMHPVTLGRAASGRVEILEGLRAKEMVVTAGVFTLKSAILRGTFGEEGHH